MLSYLGAALALWIAVDIVFVLAATRASQMRNEASQRFRHDR